jgi:peptide/nickel transport system substrate-binding protein
MNLRKRVIRQFLFTAACFLLLMGASAQLWSRDLVICDDISDPATLDPQKQFSEKNHTLLQQIFEGLVRFDPDGKIEPALAESWERIDPLRVRFKLRKGVFFHNSEPFDAESVRFSISRYLDPTTGFPAIGFINSLDRVEVIDPHTVDIITKFPDGLLLNRLAGFVLIVPANNIDGIGSHPIGTGPFKFVLWEKGKRVKLAANKKYWMAGFPKVDGLSFEFIPASQQIDRLLDGSVDLIMDVPGTMTTMVVSSGKAKISKRPSFYTFTASLRVGSGPLSDLRVRKAMNYALNKAELIRYDVFGNGKELATLTMSGQVGHNKELEPYPFDLAKAKQLMEKAGYDKGFTLNVFVKPQAERPFRIIKKQLEAIGIRLIGEYVPDGQMIKKLGEKTWDMTFGDCPDPMAHSFFIQAIVLYSRSPFSLMRSEPYDKLLEGMVTTLELDKQREIGETIDRYIYDNALSLFTYERIRTYGHKRNLYFTPWITSMPYFYSAYFGKNSAKLVDEYE